MRIFRLTATKAWQLKRTGYRLRANVGNTEAITSA
jgi:hypothetical protein